MLVQIALQYPVFNTFGYIPSSGTAGSQGGSIFKFLWNFCTVFYHNCTNLHSHQECTVVPFSLCPCQHLLSFVFLMIVILTPVRWYLIVVLICIFMMIHDNQYLLCIYRPFVRLWKNVYSVCPYFNQMDWLGQMGYYQVVWFFCVYWMLTPCQIYNLQIFSIYSSFFADHINLLPFTFIRFWSKAWTSKD